MRFTLKLLSSSSSVFKKSWREASTLLIASEASSTSVSDRNNSDSMANTNNKSLEYLMLERSKESSFMPGGLCFPGGAISLADSSKHWYDLYLSAGLNLTSIKLMDASANKPDIYGAEYKEPGEFLSREVSFRITAIRETFEECGILLCKPFHNTSISNDPKLLDNFLNNKEKVAIWQNKIKSDPENFICLCDILKCVPDLPALVEWSNWLTPVTFKLTHHRFDTMFYMTLLSSSKPRPQVFPDGEEMSSFKWSTASNLLNAHVDGIHFLLPPQTYEMCRLVKINRAEEMEQLLKFRYTLGIERWCPFLFRTKDKCVISAFPGDDLYPGIPDFHTYHEFDILDLTYEELNRTSEAKHRSFIPKKGMPSVEVSSTVGRFGQSYTPLS